MVKKIMLVGLLLLLLLAAAPGAVEAPATAFCSGLLLQPFGQNASLIQNLGLIGIAMVVVLLMSVVIALVYALGYSFGIEHLVRFARAEIGEIMLTAAIIAVFAGFIYGSNGLAQLSYSQYTNIFQADCSFMAASSVTTLGTILTYFTPATLELSALSGFTVSWAPNLQGIKVSPLLGFGFVISMLTTLSEFITAIGIMLLGITVFLGIVYAIFPLFLFLGIVLRTLPITRAAGGGFLGFFIGFYIIFPLILFSLLSVSPALTAPQQPTPYDAPTFISNIASSLAGAAISSFDISPLIQTFVSDVLDPVFWALFAVVIAVIVSFDMSELFADVLGAESLSTRHMMRKII